MKRIFVLFAVVLIGACQDTSDPTALDLGVAFAKAPGGAGAVVSGSAHIFLNRDAIPGEHNLREFTVNVTRRRDGSVGGTMHLGSVGLRPGLANIGEVTCVTVVDNGDGTKDAWIGGTNRHSNFKDGSLGAQFGVRIRDVGGPSAGNDRMSGLKFSSLVGNPNIGDDACNNTPGWGMFLNSSGNLTIH